MSLVHCWGCCGNKEAAVPNLASDPYLGAYLCLKPLLFSLSAPGIFLCQVFIPVVFLLPCFWSFSLSYYSFSQVAPQSRLKYHLLRAALLISRDNVRPCWTIYLLGSTYLKGKLTPLLALSHHMVTDRRRKTFPKGRCWVGQRNLLFCSLCYPCVLQGDYCIAQTNVKSMNVNSLWWSSKWL